MNAYANYEKNISNSIRALIECKSKRDQTPFTIYKLAKALGMPHSVLIKLIHTDENKRVHNPRIDTLTKIVNFFKQDGFQISIDDVLIGLSINTLLNTADEKQKTNSLLKA